MITHSEAKVEAQKIVAQMTIDEKIGQINFRAPAIQRWALRIITIGMKPFMAWRGRGLPPSFRKRLA